VLVFASSIAKSYLRHHAVKAGPFARGALCPLELLSCHFARKGPFPDGNRKFAGQYQQQIPNEFLPVRSYICAWQAIFAVVARHSKKMVAAGERASAGPVRFKTLATPGSTACKRC
jgi:hypothetical protein